MAAHKSFSTSERLAPLAIISSVRFSAANRDSACDGVVVFGPCLDSDPAGCTTLAAALSWISWIGWRRDSGELIYRLAVPGPSCQTVILDCKNNAHFLTRSQEIANDQCRGGR